MITDLFLNIFAISMATSLIIIFLLVFTPFLNKRYAIKWKYLMWIIIAIRLVIPFHMDISIPTIIIEVPAPFTAPIDTVNENGTGLIPSGEINPADVTNGTAMKTLPRTRQEPVRLSFLDAIAYLWLTGCLLFLGVHIVSFLHYKQRIMKKGTIVKEDYILQQVRRLSGKLQIRPNITVLRYKDADSPMVIGFLKPALVLPDCHYSKEELFFVLKHELVHIKRHDIYFKLLFVTANAIHWFNPFIYIMQKEAVVDMELSCDEKVIRQTSYAVRKAYTETLFSTFSRQHKKKTTLTTQFYGSMEIMKRRFKNILAASPKKNGLPLCICAVCITLISGMLIGCSSIKNDLSEESPQMGTGITNADAKDLADIKAETSDDSSTDIKKDAEPENHADIQTDLAQETTFETMAYIKSSENGSISFDRAEWVEVPGRRAEELGITADDAPGGFSVYNQEELIEKYSLSSACSINLLDWENSYTPIEIPADDFFQILEDRGEQNEFIPYTISVENGQIIKIEEHYVP